MSRLMIAMLFALIYHALLLFLPASWNRESPVELTGSRSIRVQLSAVKAAHDMTEVSPEKELKRQPVTVPPMNVGEQSQDLETAPKTSLEKDKIAQPVVPEPPPKVQEPVVLIAKAQKVIRPKKQAGVAPPAPKQSVPRATPPELSALYPPGSSGTSSPPHDAEPSSDATAFVEARPLYRKNPKPVYPKIARSRNWQGVVILAVQVTAGGHVEEIRVQKSSGHDLLDTQAMKAVKRWQFVPGTKGGVAIAMEVLVPIRFVLRIKGDE